MSTCPEWSALARRRDLDAAGEAAWESALAHLDAGCRRCAAEAHAADPTVMFRRLSAPEVGVADVAAMREAVASLRRAGRVGADSVVRRSSPGRRLTLAAGWRQLAAAAVLAAGAAGLWLTVPEEPAIDPAAAVLPAGPGLPQRALPAGADFVVPGLLAPALAGEPAVVELSQPRAADVYEMGEGDLTLVMVVDETLDV